MSQEDTVDDLIQVSEVELFYKSKINASKRITIRTAEDAYRVFLTYWDSGKIDFIEQFKLLLLNRSKKVLGIIDISSGGLAGTVVDIRLIFVAALKAKALSIIVAHNHPSGNPIPSHADIAITQRLRDAGKILTIELDDHIIITSEGFYSFKKEGILL